MNEVQIRQATAQDDLTPLLGALAAYAWNREHVLVADREGVLLGLVILWDSGHEILHVDHLVVREDHRAECVGLALIQGCEAEARRRGAKVIVASTPNVMLAAGAMRKGVKVSVPMFTLWREL